MIAIGTEYLNRNHYTGIDRYTSSLISAFKDLNLLQENRISTFSYDEGFDYPHFKIPGNRKINAIKTLIGMGVKLDIPGCKIIHSTSPMDVTTNSKLIVTVHDIAPLIFPEAYSLGMPLLFHKTLKNLKKKGANIICNSKNTANNVIEYFKYPQDKVFITYPGIDTIRFNSLTTNQNIFKKYNLPARYFFFTGSLNKRKNLFYLIDAFKIYIDQIDAQPISLVISGRYEWGGSELKNYIYKKKISDSLICFPGYIEEDDLPGFYHFAEALIYPSFYEGFGFPPLEALASGGKAVISDRGSLREVVREFGIYIDPYETNSLVEVMMKLHKNEIKEHSKEDVAKLLENYKWSDTAVKTCEIYTLINEGQKII